MLLLSYNSQWSLVYSQSSATTTAIHFRTFSSAQKETLQPWPAWLSWLECHPIHQKGGDSILREGTCLGCRFDPWLGRIWEAANWCFSFTSMFLFFYLFFYFLFFYFFLNIFIDYAITVVPFPPPLHSILPTPSLPHSPPIVHVHGSYL